jgi:hypothetical protein
MTDMDDIAVFRPQAVVTGRRYRRETSYSLIGGRGRLASWDWCRITGKLPSVPPVGTHGIKERGTGTSDERYMQWYKAEIEAAEPLNLDEERTCIEHIRACDEFAMSARERLVGAYTSLVVAIAETYGDRGVRVPDLLVDGNEALVAAVDTFCDSRESSFKPYVARLVEQAISRAAVHLPGYSVITPDE